MYYKLIRYFSVHIETVYVCVCVSARVCKHWKQEINRLTQTTTTVTMTMVTVWWCARASVCVSARHGCSTPSCVSEACAHRRFDMHGCRPRPRFTPWHVLAECAASSPLVNMCAVQPPQMCIRDSSVLMSILLLWRSKGTFVNSSSNSSIWEPNWRTQAL